MKALINVDYSEVYRVGECGFNEDVYLSNKNKYSATVVDDSKVVWDACNAEKLRVPDILRERCEDVATAIYNEATKRNCFRTLKLPGFDLPFRTYTCLVIIDVADEALHAKCKLLGIDTKIMLRFSFTEQPYNDEDHEYEYIVDCDIANIGDIDINV